MSQYEIHTYVGRIYAGLKALWTKALRSGEYTQGKSVLRRDDKFCCLGVACDLYSKEHPEYPVRDYKDSYTYGPNAINLVLPTEVQEWLFEYTTQHDGHNPAFTIVSDTDSQCISLAELNDSGFTFSQIADVIDYMF